METWKQVEGYEGRYEVSSYGRVKSFVVNKQNGRIMHPVKSSLGYMVVRLYDWKGGSRWYPVHRLVAKAFIENPDNLPQINHKDEVKDNNRVENLEWCTRKYNVNYGTRIQRVIESHINNKYLSKKVYSIDKDGNVEEFVSVAEAERQTGLSHCNIVRTLKGRTKCCGGRQWFYCE